MKRTIIIIIQVICSFWYCYAQSTGAMTEEALYAQAERGIKLMDSGDYVQACQLLRGVAESGQLDKPSLGMMAYYLCDGYYNIAENQEEGSREKYETLKECYRWLGQVDWKQFPEVNASDARTNVVSAYVTAMHFYSGTLTDPSEAISLEVEAMGLYQSIAKDDMNMGVIKAHLHELYMETGQWDESIKMAKDAEKIVFDNGGKVGDLIRIYSNLAMIYNQKGEIQNSGLYANRVFTCMEGLNEDDLNYEERTSYSVALYYLAICYQQLAKPVYYDYFKRAYHLIKINDDIRHERYFRELLLQLVITSRSLNDREYTAKYLDELLTLCKGYESPLGRIYNEALSYYMEELVGAGEKEQAYRMISDFMGSWQENQLLKNVEASDFEEWSMDDRIALFMHVLSILIYDYTDEVLKSPEIVKTLRALLDESSKTSKEACALLSYLYYRQGDYASCLSYGHKAMEYDAKDLERDMFVMQLMVNSARYLKKYDNLELYNHALFTDDKIMLKRNFLNVTSEVRSNYWTQAESNFVATISNAMVCNTAKSMELAYDASLCRKGVLLSTEIGMARIVEESRDTCLQRMYADLKQIHSARNELALRGDEQAARYLAVETDKLEGEIIQRVQQYKGFDRMFDFSWKDISRKLSAQEAAVEFEQYIDDNGTLRYVALLLTNGQIHKVDLFTEEELKAMIKAGVYADGTLTQRLWLPVLNEVKSAKRLYFAPCGLLYNVAIESLRNDVGFVSEGVQLIRLSSTRELVQNSRKRKSSSNAMLYGGLQYDMGVDEMVAAASTTPKLRGSMSSIEPLPATLDEVKAISSTLSVSNISSIVLSDTKGTERSLKELSGQPLCIMHIATHGFYNDRVPDEISSLSGQTTIQRGISEEDFTLSRSGLLLAGAENKLMGEDIPQNVDDGILTAQEISALDFSGLDLVTLSACETALGEIRGDGVFGLQRGFKLAGANSILMSLWKVDDAATTKLMTEFYSNWIGKKMTKHDALEAAKKTVRETKGWEDPKYWAAFILLDALD